MAIRIMPQTAIEPVRSQTGGVQGGIEPMRDASGASMVAVGEGAQDLGRALTVLADRKQDQVDLAMSQRMRNLLDAEHEKELRDPQSGYLTRLGMDANDAEWGKAKERLRVQREKIAAMGQNEAQRMNFTEFADRRDAESMVTANVHQVRELRNFRAGETKVAVERGIERSIRYEATEEGAISFEMAMRDLDTLADLYGYPKDSAIRAKMKQDAKDQKHSGVIDAMVSDEMPTKARNYFLDVRKDMSPDAEARAERLVNRAVLDVGARNAAARAYAEAENEVRMRRDDAERDQPLGIVDQEYIKQRVYGIIDQDENMSPAMRAEATQRLDFIARRRAQVQAGEIDVAMTQAEAWLSQNPNAGTSEMPPQLFLVAQRAGRLPQLNDFARSGRYVTNSDAYKELDAMSKDGRLAAMSELEFRAEFRGRLDNHDFAYGKALHDRATGKTGADVDVIGQRERIEESAVRLGIMPREARNRSPAQDSAFYDYRQNIQKRIDAQRAAQPDKKFGHEELQKVIDEATMDKVFVDEWGTDPEKSAVTLTKDEQDAAYVIQNGQPAYVREIPPAQRDAIVNTLLRRGNPVSEKVIREMWEQAGRPQ